MLELFVNVRKEQPSFILTPENLNSEEYVKICSKLSENKIIKLQFTAECVLNQPEEFLITLIQEEFKAYILSINNLDVIISNQLVPELNLPKDIRRINAKIYKAEQFPVLLNPIKNDLTPKKNRKTVSRKEKNRYHGKEENQTPIVKRNQIPKKEENRPKREGPRTPRRDGGAGPATRRRDGKPLQRRDGSRPPNSRPPRRDGNNRPSYRKEGDRSQRRDGGRPSNSRSPRRDGNNRPPYRKEGDRSQRRDGGRPPSSRPPRRDGKRTTKKEGNKTQ